MSGSVFPASGIRRRFRLVPIITGLLVLPAAAGLRAADAPAPTTLDEIKGDLKSIKRDGRDPGASDASPANVALPQLRVDPAPASAAPARPPAGPNTDRTGRRVPDKNWLLKGVELQTKSEAAARTRDPRTARDETPLLDTSDPDFMLRLYLAQSAAERSREEARPRDGAPDPAAAGVGSFDTFLSEWVSKRDPALRDLIAAASSPSAGEAPTGPRAALRIDEPSPPSTPAANPFLAALGPDWTGATAAPTVYGAPSPGTAAPLPPPAAAPDARDRAPASQPPNPADDKKYFPQLNRF